MRLRFRKTYGVRGLLEWKMAITAGKAAVRINFSGGTMGSNGVRPAKFVTDNPAIQALIESGEHYRSGKVFLYGEPEEIGQEETSDCPPRDNCNPLIITDCINHEDGSGGYNPESGYPYGGEP